MSLRSAKTRYGDCWFYGKDEYIGRSIFSYGEFSGEECEKLIQLLDGGVFADVGANIGFMSMAMGDRGYAFEPQPELFKLLEKNAKCECLPFALSSAEGKAKMPRIRYGDKGNYGGLGLGLKSELGTIEVNCKTLDSFNLDVNLIKIDVEGHELEVLKGGVETIERCKPIMYIEDDRPDKSYELRAFIKHLGYKIVEHNTYLFRENNFYGNTHNIWNKPFMSYNIICSK